MKMRYWFLLAVVLYVAGAFAYNRFGPMPSANLEKPAAEAADFKRIEEKLKMVHGVYRAEVGYHTWDVEPPLRELMVVVYLNCSPLSTVSYYRQIARTIVDLDLGMKYLDREQVGMHIVYKGVTRVKALDRMSVWPRKYVTDWLKEPEPDLKQECR